MTKKYYILTPADKDWIKANSAKFTMPEMAYKLKCDLQNINKFVRWHKLPFVKHDKRRYFSADELDYIRANINAPRRLMAGFLHISESCLRLQIKRMGLSSDVEVVTKPAPGCNGLFNVDAMAWVI